MGIGSPGHPRNRGKPIMSAACLGQELMRNGDAIAAATQTTLVTILMMKSWQVDNFWFLAQDPASAAVWVARRRNATFSSESFTGAF